MGKILVLSEVDFSANGIQGDIPVPPGTGYWLKESMGIEFPSDLSSIRMGSAAYSEPPLISRALEGKTIKKIKFVVGEVSDFGRGSFCFGYTTNFNPELPVQGSIDGSYIVDIIDDVNVFSSEEGESSLEWIEKQLNVPLILPPGAMIYYRAESANYCPGNCDFLVPLTSIDAGLIFPEVPSVGQQ